MISVTRYVVLGAGAIGGAIGGRLVEAGFDTLLVARGAHLAALQRDGLRLDEAERSRTIPVTAASEVEWKPGDVVLLCVKSQDTAAALATVPHEVPVVCVQNSVRNEQTAVEAGFTDVYGVCVALPAEHLEPGVVVNAAVPFAGILDISRYPEGVDDRAVAIATDLEAAGFRSVAIPAIMPWKYRKLLVNLTNAADAVCGLDDPDLRALNRAAREEGERCLTAAGIGIVSVEEDKARRTGFRIVAVNGRTRQGSSTWQSLHRGGTLETDLLNGEIVRLGREHGVATPVNEILLEAADDLARRGVAPGSMRAADLLARAAGAARGA